MKITKNLIRKMILKEAASLIREGHGCGCGACTGCAAKDSMGDIHDMSSVDHRDMMAHSVYDEPSHGDIPGMTHILDMGGMGPDEAFGAGYSAGQEQRDAFDYTGDLSDLTPDEAIGLGYEAGMMGLAGDESAVPHPESYDAVMEFLHLNPDLVDSAVENIMMMTGATCQASTRKAITDYLERDSHGMGCAGDSHGDLDIMAEILKHLIQKG